MQVAKGRSPCERNQRRQEFSNEETIPKYPSTGEGETDGAIHREYYFAIKGTKYRTYGYISIYICIWINPEQLMLSESQSEAFSTV